MNTVLEQHPSLVAEAAPEARAEFIRRTYTHLAMAILAFVGLEVIFFQSGLAYALTNAVVGAGRIRLVHPELARSRGTRRGRKQSARGQA